MEGGKRLVRGNCEEERWPVSKLAGLSKTTHMAFSAVRRPSCVGVVPLMVFVVDQKPDQGVKPLVTELSSPNAPRFLAQRKWARVRRTELTEIEWEALVVGLGGSAHK